MSFLKKGLLFGSVPERGRKGADGADSPDDGHEAFKKRKSKLLDTTEMENTVMGKLKKGNRQAAQLPESELREWARSLCIEPDLKECYLNPVFAKTATFFNDLTLKQQQYNAEASKGDTQSSLRMISASTGSAAGPVGRLDDDIEDTDFQMDDITTQNEQPHYNLNQKQIKIKLIIAEIAKGDLQKTIRKMLSPVLTKFDHQQQFGMFHSAIVIGPWYIEWNNSSLCIPRKCYSGAATLAADLQPPQGLSKKMTMEEAIEKVAKVVIDWNLNKTYDQSTANCQHFVDDVCRNLGIVTDFPGPLGEYISRLREKGICDMSFSLNPDLREKFEIKATKHTFNTHADLDTFVHKILNKDPLFEENNKQEWALLKSFDRAFWLRHYKSPEDPKYKPLEDDNDSECPFRDPQVTLSLKRDWF